jgi:hypothetical protein
VRFHANLRWTERDPAGPAPSSESIANIRKHQPGRLVVRRGFGAPSAYRRGLTPTQTTPIAEPSSSSIGEPDVLVSGWSGTFTAGIDAVGRSSTACMQAIGIANAASISFFG